MPSASVLEQKKKLVDLLADKIKHSQSIVLADYRGLTVEQDTQMREDLRKAGIDYKVYKNTLAKRAAISNGYEALEKYLEGPTAIAFSETDPVLPSKMLVEYAKKFKMLEVKAGIVEGKVVGEAEIKQLAELPSREELVAKALGALNSPIVGFVNVLNGNLRGLVVALNAIREQKEQ
jgi:large subunit ribosomal protein L10